ncbi:MAG: hypothetical protein ABSG62_14385 [Terracidiphilus sp.]|jgi:hypothetical protein
MNPQAPIADYRTANVDAAPVFFVDSYRALFGLPSNHFTIGIVNVLDDISDSGKGRNRRSCLAR